MIAAHVVSCNLLGDRLHTETRIHPLHLHTYTHIMHYGMELFVLFASNFNFTCPTSYNFNNKTENFSKKYFVELNIGDENLLRYIMCLQHVRLVW